MTTYDFIQFFTYDFIWMLILLVGLFIFIILLKETFGRTHVIFTIFILGSCVITSVLNIIALGYAADELSTGGDPNHMYMFLAIITIAIINLIIAYRKYKLSLGRS